MDNTINILSLCAGVGMLDIGIHAAVEYLGFDPRVLGYCERDAYAAACLLARMEDQTLGRAPVWCGDMRDLDARPLRGYADLVCAGLPCPAFSLAGKQAGLADDRAWGGADSPIPQFLRIVAECGPALVFLENVPPFVRGGFFRAVGEELCRLGYEIAPPVFLAAGDVGASHRRERVFILAFRAGGRLRELRQSSRRDGQPDGGGQTVADAASPRPIQPRVGGIESEAAGDCGMPGLGIRCYELADAIRTGREESRHSSSSASGSGPRAASWGSVGALFAPGPGDLDGWSRVVADGSFDFRAPAIKPGVRVLADGMSLVVDASRADQLRCGGNGCVPLQAAVAFVALFRGIGLT